MAAEWPAGRAAGGGPGAGERRHSRRISGCLPACPRPPPCSYRLGDRPPAPRRNFQAHWQYACEAQWRLAFIMFSAGMPVFFLNMALAAWIKVPDVGSLPWVMAACGGGGAAGGAAGAAASAPHQRAPFPSPQFDYSTPTAATMTALMAAALLIFLVAQNRWSWHLLGSGGAGDRLLDEAMPQPPPGGLPWDWHQRPAPGPSIAVVGARSSSQNGAAPGLEKRSSVGMQRLDSEAGGG